MIMLPLGNRPETTTTKVVRNPENIEVGDIHLQSCTHKKENLCEFKAKVIVSIPPPKKWYQKDT